MPALLKDLNGSMGSVTLCPYARDDVQPWQAHKKA